MQLKSTIKVLLLVFLFSLSSELIASNKIKVACVGDSITFGAGIPEPHLNGYPAQLQKLLGDQWQVANFGWSGATLMSKGDHPYIKTPQYQNALNYKPDVVIIKLGTNDTKPQNWKRHRNTYINDYTIMIRAFQALESKPSIWLCKAVPVFPERWGISDDTVNYEINPRVDHLGKKLGLPVIDLYSTLKPFPQHFPDKVHPTAEGAKIMAQKIAPLLQKHGDQVPPVSKQQGYKGNKDLVLWDDEAAYDFEVAYPVGSGRLGAMPFGTFPNERILINEDSIWAYEEALRMPEDSFTHLEKVRELEAAAQYKEADKYFETHLSGAPGRKSPYSYQLLGWLKIHYKNTATLKSTQRLLDLKTGVATCQYILEDNAVITQELIASYPDDIIALKISSDKDFEIDLSLDQAKVVDGDLVLESQADGKNGTKFMGRVRVLENSAPSANAQVLQVKKNKAVTILISVATDFNAQDALAKLANGWQNKARKDLDALKNKTYKAIKSDAIKDHQKYLNRVDADFGKTPENILKLSTKDRLERLKQNVHDDPDLMETYFQFGRYLLIASSRPGTLPANLQGVWNAYKNPPWASDYHLNINIEMNYWPAETTNLSELHTPFFDLIRLYQPMGKDMAKRLGMKGWCMPHSSDLWGSARLMGVMPLWAASFTSGQWMTFHILEQYRFTKNIKLLEDNWDILTSSTEFVESWLIPGPDGRLIARPASSPENVFRYKDAQGQEQKASLIAGNTYDQFMILQVMSDYLEAAEALGKENDAFVQRIKAVLPKIYQPQIAQDGRLMEWRLPFVEDRPWHRHISHVIGAYPGNQINLDKDPKMRSAVLKVLEGRLKHGGAGTGWSRAWMIGMFARFSDKKRAYENLHAILTKSTLPNLWDNHPPFQIDGNFGATAAIAEMLLHSHNNEIKLLPALPDKWPNGFIKGLKARGDYTVDITWKNGQLNQVLIKAGKMSAPTVKINYNGVIKELSLAPHQSLQLKLSDFQK